MFYSESDINDILITLSSISGSVVANSVIFSDYSIINGEKCYDKEAVDEIINNLK